MKPRADAPMAVDTDELLTVPQVLAALGGVSRRTFYRWRETGMAPECLRLPNGELRMWRSVLQEWLDTLKEDIA